MSALGGLPGGQHGKEGGFGRLGWVNRSSLCQGDPGCSWPLGATALEAETQEGCFGGDVWGQSSVDLEESSAKYVY